MTSPAPNGFSLVELLLVLGVVALLLVASFVVYPSIRDASQAHRVAVEFRAGLARIRGVSTGRTGYTWVNDSTIINAGVFPKSWVVPNGLNPYIAIPSPQGQTRLVLQSSSLTGATGSSVPVNQHHVKVTLYGLKGYFCQRLLAEMATGAIYLRVDNPVAPYGAIFLDPQNPSASQRKPSVNPAALAAACDASNTFNMVY